MPMRAGDPASRRRCRCRSLEQVGDLPSTSHDDAADLTAETAKRLAASLAKLNAAYYRPRNVRDQLRPRARALMQERIY